MMTSLDRSTFDNIKDRYGVNFRIEGDRVIARNFDGQTWAWRNVGLVSDFEAPADRESVDE